MSWERRLGSRRQQLRQRSPSDQWDWPPWFLLCFRPVLQPWATQLRSWANGKSLGQVRCSVELRVLAYRLLFSWPWALHPKFGLFLRWQVLAWASDMSVQSTSTPSAMLGIGR